MTKQMTKTKRKQSAFTLVELLVVIAILAVLISVVVIGYTQFIDKSYQAKADSEADQIRTILQGHMALEDEVEVKDGPTTIVKLKFEYDGNDVPKLTYTGNLDNFKDAFPDLEGLEGTYEFEYDSTDSTRITKITYKLPSKYKEKKSYIEVAKLFPHQEVPEP